VFVTATDNVSPCCHSFLETTLVVEKIVIGPCSKSGALESVTSLESLSCFVEDSEENDYGTFDSTQSSSNDFQEWLRLTT